MGASILKQLKKDKQDLEEAQQEIITNAQDTILRLEGALVYVTKLIEHLEEKKPKEDKEDASTS